MRKSCNTVLEDSFKMVQRASNNLGPKKHQKNVGFVFNLNLSVAGHLALSGIFFELTQSKFPLLGHLHLVKQ